MEGNQPGKSLADAAIVYLTMTKAKIHYYCREGYYHAMESAALDAIKKFQNDKILKFYYCLAVVLQRQISTGLREIAPLLEDSDLNLGAILICMHAHRLQTIPDRDKILRLDTTLKAERKRAAPQSLYFAGLVLFFIGKYDRAVEYVDRTIRAIPHFPAAKVLRSWIDIASRKDGNLKEACEMLDSVIQNDPRDIEANFAKAKYFELSHNFQAAVDLYNKVTINYGNFIPAFTERMKMHLALQDWDQALDVANRIMKHDSHNLEATKLTLLHSLCQKGKYEEVAAGIADYYKDVENQESKNPKLYVDLARLFSRICGRNISMLAETLRFAEKARDFDSTSAEYASEVGHQYLLQGKMKDAKTWFKTATELDPSSVNAFIGITTCHLIDDDMDVANHQQEFLNDLKNSTSSSSDVLYLCALLKRKQKRAVPEVISILNETIESHFRMIRTMPFGSKYLLAMNPDFLLQVVKEYMLYAPTHILHTEKDISSWHRSIAINKSISRHHRV